MKRKILNSIVLICILVIASSCSNTKFLAEDEVLYTGIKDVEITAQGDIKKLKSIKSSISSAAFYKPNNSFISGRRTMLPVRLWIYNYMQTDKEKGFKSWMHRNFSQEPVLISDLNMDQRVTMLENQLFNQGYYASKINYELFYNKNNPKKALVKYNVLLPQPYTFDSITIKEGNFLSYSFRDDILSESLIERGDNYNLNTILSERERITNMVRDKGYYGFRKEYLEFKLDTSSGLNTVNVRIDLYSELPLIADKKYFIENVVFNLENDVPDSNSIIAPDTLRDNEYSYIYNKLFVKASVLKMAIHQVPGYRNSSFRNKYISSFTKKRGYNFWECE